jgi:hypothetical protein
MSKTEHKIPCQKSQVDRGQNGKLQTAIADGDERQQKPHAHPRAVAVLVQTNMLGSEDTERKLKCRDLSKASLEVCHAKIPAARANTLLGIPAWGLRHEPARAHPEFAEPCRQSKSRRHGALRRAGGSSRWHCVISWPGSAYRGAQSPQSHVRQRKAFAREIFRRPINWTSGNDIWSRKPVDDIAGKPLPVD